MDRRNFFKRIAGGLAAIPLLSAKAKDAIPEAIEPLTSKGIENQIVTCNDHEWITFHTTFEDGTIETHTINLRELSNGL